MTIKVLLMLFLGRANAGGALKWSCAANTNGSVRFHKSMTWISQMHFPRLATLSKTPPAHFQRLIVSSPFLTHPSSGYTSFVKRLVP
jgi:hypothetical protein